MATNQRISIHSSSDISGSFGGIKRVTPPPYMRIPALSDDAWQYFGTHISIAGMLVSGGMYYLGRSQAGNAGANDPCLVDPTLPVVFSDTIPSEQSDNASWAGMSPEMRGLYLRWLSSNRNQPDVPDSVVMLYLYGLERRLFIDGPRERFSSSERMSLEREVSRILTVYGARPRIASAVRHILAMSWAVSSSFESIDEMPDTFKMNSLECAFAVPYYIACHVEKNGAIPYELVPLWYARHPDSKQMGNAGSNRTFMQFLVESAKKRYPNGVEVKRSFDSVCIHYEAVNPGLGVLDFEMPEVRDVFSCPAAVDVLNDIAESGYQEFSVYQDYLKQPGANAIGAIFHLPIEMRSANPALKNFGSFLNNATKNGVGCVRVCDIFKSLGLPVPQALNNQLVEDIGRLLEMSCFQYAPNYRLHGAAFGVHDSIYLMPAIQAPELTSPFAILSLILRLGAIIAQSDEVVEPSEVETLQNMVMNRDSINDEQRASLLLWIHWCLNTPQQLKDIQVDLGGFPRDLCDQISQLLIKVASADGVIDPRERKVLVEIHKALGLPESWVDINLTSGSEFKIPDCEAIQAEVVANLEHRRSAPEIQAIEVSNELNLALSKICEDVPPEGAHIHKPVAQSADGAYAPSLDGAHLAFLKDLTQCAEHPRLHVFEMAIAHKLMADRAMAVLNQLARMRYGMDMITDGDVVTVDTDLARILCQSLS